MRTISRTNKTRTYVQTHPEWARSTRKTILNGVDTNGGGIANLRGVGMRGIFAFCGAVIVSILLTLIVDIFDHRAKQQVRDEPTRARSTALGRSHETTTKKIPRKTVVPWKNRCWAMGRLQLKLIWDTTMTTPFRRRLPVCFLGNLSLPHGSLPR